jgi:carboxyl-terminal processing protease
MRKLLIINMIVLATGFLFQTNAQIPDNTDGRLYRLCKTWGYFKYFNQHKCELKWDTLLNTTVNEVLVANSNEEFNEALMNMFSKAGNNSFPANPGPEPDTNFNFDNSWIDDPVFSQPVRDFLDTFSIYIYPDTSTCFVKFNDYSTPGYYSYIDFRNDPLSMTINYTNEANRLTTMFYYWNVINYFSPNRNIMDHPWDSTLYDFIPLIRQAGTVLDFHKIFLKLVTRINDSHGFTDSSVLSAYFWGGNHLPRIYFTRVDTLCVVTKVEGIAGVSKGDILIALKGIPIREIEDSLSLYVPASTPAALYRDIYYSMMYGVNNSTLDLTLLDSNNNAFTAYALRSLSLGWWFAWKDDNGLTSSYFLTTCGYGYVNLGWLMPEEVPAMYDLLKDAPVIIFDIRNYPYTGLADFAPLFFPGPIVSTDYYEPALTWLTPYNYYYLPGWYYQQNDYYNLGSWSNPDAYDGNVYILVNQETQSSGEYTCQYLSYHPNSRVLGTQTAGADGNMSDLTLPGGISTSFTSLGWFYADGYQQQRNGVKIDSIVSPTVAGIRHGRDEILEAALDCLTQVEEASQADFKVTVYPNPASRQLTVGQLDGCTVGQSTVGGLSRGSACGGYKGSTVRISIVDLYGRKIKEFANISSFPCQLDISDLPDGLYILRLINGEGISGSMKLVKVKD